MLKMCQGTYLLTCGEEWKKALRLRYRRPVYTYLILTAAEPKFETDLTLGAFDIQDDNKNY